MPNVLVAVFGNTPAVLTEAVYYYAKRAAHPLFFSEIHVFTTTAGCDVIYKTLYGTKRGQDHLRVLLDEIGSPHTYVLVHPAVDHDGHELSDIRTRDDSLCIANQMSRKLAELRADPKNIIYATIAGGRKTMGLYLVMAMQLYARPEDRLFHVLVDPRIEAVSKGSRPVGASRAARIADFYYPKKTLLINSRRIKPEEIVLDCDEIPLLVWPWASAKDSETLTFAQLVQRRNRDLCWLYEPPALVVKWKERTITIGGVPVALDPIEFFYYWFFAERTKLYGAEDAAFSLGELAKFWKAQLSKKYPPPPKREKSSEEFPRICGKLFLARKFPDLRGNLYFDLCCHLEELFYNVVHGEDGLKERLDYDLSPTKTSTTTMNLTIPFSRIARKMEKVVGPLLCNKYSIRRHREGRGSRYALWLEAGNIDIQPRVSATAARISGGSGAISASPEAGEH